MGNAALFGNQARWQRRYNPTAWLGEVSETRYWMYLLLVPSLVLILAVVLYPTI